MLVSALQVNVNRARLLELDAASTAVQRVRLLWIREAERLILGRPHAEDADLLWLVADLFRHEQEVLTNELVRLSQHGIERLLFANLGARVSRALSCQSQSSPPNRVLVESRPSVQVVPIVEHVSHACKGAKRLVDDYR